MREFSKELRSNFTLQQIIDYMENTSEESWCTDVVRTDDGRNCFFGHLFDLGGEELFCSFENIATSYMIYPVNDGYNPEYQQLTPKQRCLAYLKNIQAGKERTTSELMEKEWLTYSKNHGLYTPTPS